MGKVLGVLFKISPAPLEDLITADPRTSYGWWGHDSPCSCLLVCHRILCSLCKIFRTSIRVTGNLLSNFASSPVNGSLHALIFGISRGDQSSPLLHRPRQTTTLANSKWMKRCAAKLRPAIQAFVLGASDSQNSDSRFLSYQPSPPKQNVSYQPTISLPLSI